MIARPIKTSRRFALQCLVLLLGASTCSTLLIPAISAGSVAAATATATNALLLGFAAAGNTRLSQGLTAEMKGQLLEASAGMKGELAEIKGQLAERSAKMESQLAERSAKMESQLAKMDAKMESQLAKADAKMESQLAKADAKMESLAEQSAKMESQLGKMREDTKTTHRELNEVKDSLKQILAQLEGNSKWFIR